MINSQSKSKENLGNRLTYINTDRPTGQSTNNFTPSPFSSRGHGILCKHLHLAIGLWDLSNLGLGRASDSWAGCRIWPIRDTLRRRAGPGLRRLWGGRQVGVLTGQMEVMLGSGWVAVLGRRCWVILCSCSAATWLGGQALSGLGCWSCCLWGLSWRLGLRLLLRHLLLLEERWWRLWGLGCRWGGGTHACCVLLVGDGVVDQLLLLLLMLRNGGQLNRADSGCGGNGCGLQHGIAIKLLLVH